MSLTKRQQMILRYYDGKPYCLRCIDSNKVIGSDAIVRDELGQGENGRFEKGGVCSITEGHHSTEVYAFIPSAGEVCPVHHR